MLGVYGLTQAEFFGGTIEHQIAPWELDDEENATQRLLEDLRDLPRAVQRAMVSKFELMLETASAVDRVKRADQSKRMSDKRPAFVRDAPDWHMLTSRN